MGNSKTPPLLDISLLTFTLDPNNSSNSTSTSGTVLDLTGCKIVTTNFTFLPWDNPDMVITARQQVEADMVMGGVMIPIISFVGLITNVICIFVFYKQGLKARINTLLFCLAWADLAVEFYMFVHTIEFFYTLVLGKFDSYGPVLSYTTNNLFNMLNGFIYVSGFISTLIALDRCICTTHPFTAQKIMKAKATAAFVVLTSAVLVSVHFMVVNKYRIGCVYLQSLGDVSTNYYPSDFYLEHKQITDILNSIMYGLTLPLFFVTTTTVATSVTALKLKSSAQFRKGMKGKARGGGASQQAERDAVSKEVQLTKMLIAVSILFIAMTIPQVLVRVFGYIVPEFQLGRRQQNLFMVGNMLSHLTPAVNCCLNFFFYFKMGSKFRSTLYALFFRVSSEVGRVAGGPTTVA